ncbi:MAG: hypothetical protein K8F91_05900, partial [Candidatus Obscuribacterales bacterium]|nr:hypothetical protein [Candidatus Obscuribacterales bacterium]
PNTRNSPPITGEAENQLNFVKSAGNRFPVMANFSFDYGNSHWLFLDGNAYMDWSNKRMRDFVKSDLKASRQLFKFVCYHQPSFSVDRAHFKEQRMRLLCDIFEKEGVTAVFSGHAHNYQRSYPLKFKVKRKNGLPLEKADGIVNGELNLDHEFDGIKNKQPRGVIYIVSGAGGAPLYSRIEKTPGQKSFTSVFSGNLHSYTFCTVNGKVLKISQISEDGEEIDSFSIEK